MKRNELDNNHYEFLKQLSGLPQKMLQMHGQQNITEFVLHELSNNQCLNFQKVAYFVDNPDFDCMKGVAGWNRDECKISCNIWQNPEEFSKVMSGSLFNQQVRNFSSSSLKNKSSDEEIAAVIAKNFNMSSYGYCSIGVKHDNHGILVYEPQITNASVKSEDVVAGLSLLGLCSIY